VHAPLHVSWDFQVESCEKLRERCMQYAFMPDVWLRDIVAETKAWNMTTSSSVDSVHFLPGGEWILLVSFSGFLRLKRVADGQEVAEVLFAEDGIIDYYDFVACEESGCRIALLLETDNEDDRYVQRSTVRPKCFFVNDYTIVQGQFGYTSWTPIRPTSIFSST
jgi:hypothetical protein